jgi:ATPase subunit of ABC transporter with duplicated ATPase domains
VHEHADALERFLSLGADDFHARAREAAARVGLDRLDRRLGRLSGGEAARAKLVAILLSRFDVLLLDEPTNDLDFDGLELLERFVASTPSALVLVSHDRAFLERFRVVGLRPTRRIRETCRRLVGTSTPRAGRLGNEGAYERYVGERERFEALLRRRQGEARAAGKMADRRGTHALMSKVRNADKRLERLQQVEKPWSPWRLELSLGSQRGGEVVARLEEAVVEREGFRLGPIDLELRHGDRLAIVGPNGSGKSTLIAALVGALPLRAAGASSTGILRARAGLRGSTGRPLVELRRPRRARDRRARTLLAKSRPRHRSRTGVFASPGSEPERSWRCCQRRACG